MATHRKWKIPSLKETLLYGPVLTRPTSSGQTIGGAADGQAVTIEKPAAEKARIDRAAEKRARRAAKRAGEVR